MANFRKLMAEASDLGVLGRPYPRMQLLSVPEMLEGKRFETPTPLGSATAGQSGLHW